MKNDRNARGYDRPLKWSTKHELLRDHSDGWKDGRGRRKRRRPLENNQLDSYNSKDSPGTAESTLPAHETQRPGIPDTADFYQTFFEEDFALAWGNLSGAQDPVLWGTTEPADAHGLMPTTEGHHNQKPMQQSNELVTQHNTSGIAGQVGNVTTGGLAAHLPTAVDESATIDASIGNDAPELLGFDFPSRLNTPFFILEDNRTPDKQHLLPLQPAPENDDGQVTTSEINLRVTLSPRPAFKTLNDDSSVLVEFYFKETAQLFSCFDGILNPYRTTVSKIWSSSPLIYHSLASMAATSLLENFPQFVQVGQHHRMEALRLLQKGEPVTETTLLALLMLGGTAAWHDPKESGVAFFNLLHTRLNARLQENISQAESKNLRFFQESLTYWEMLLAYVVDDSRLSSSRESPLTETGLNTDKVPHPWTGVAKETQFLVQRVGRLVRQQRYKTKQRHFTTQSQIKWLQKALSRARDLERRLLELSGKHSDTDIVNPGDGETPIWHLTSLAEVYRCTGLIQLYRVFPDLLCCRVETKGHSAMLTHEGTISASHLPPSSTDEQKTRATETVVNQWLTMFTVKTLELLRTIPLESGTRDFQPFLLVACCSELRVVVADNPSSPDGAMDNVRQVPVSRSDVCKVDGLLVPSPLNFSVLRARGLIYSRLKSFLYMLPPKPIRICLDIVETSWMEMDDIALDIAIKRQQSARRQSSDGSSLRELLEDDGEDGDSSEVLYWMDVMMEHGLETVMA
ncbi:C6 zinc finger domain protein [Cladophialophora carrionii]|uniref:C6 zinc finger domain protein n=1 Tax=Cladophialophora carrionii TaxID=86049 RepID=A0A1C1CV25_9EURO|nr:C6 zinc finger domain protein [Cladophialophora carrionii]